MIRAVRRAQNESLTLTMVYSDAKRFLTGGRRRSPLPPHISDILIGCLQYEGGLQRGAMAKKTLLFCTFVNYSARDCCLLRCKGLKTI